jgi:hypothetical protein
MGPWRDRGRPCARSIAYFSSISVAFGHGVGLGMIAASVRAKNALRKHGITIVYGPTCDRCCRPLDPEMTPNSGIDDALTVA